MSFYKTYPIDEFYSELIKVDSVKDALEAEFGIVGYQNIVEHVMNNGKIFEIEYNFEDIIQNMVIENFVNVKTFAGNGSNGSFPITIKKFGPLYWVDAQEFDNIKYFKSYEEASDCALTEYASFLYPESYDEENEEN